jgi:hypothetical protein
MGAILWVYRAVLVGTGWLAVSSLQLGSARPIASAASAIIVASALILFATFTVVLKLRWRGAHTGLLIAWAVLSLVDSLSAQAALTPIWIGFTALALAACAMLARDTGRHPRAKWWRAYRWR